MKRWIILALWALALISPAHAHPPGQNPLPEVELELGDMPQVDYDLGTLTIPSIRIEPLPEAVKDLEKLLRYQVTLRDGGQVVHQFTAKPVDLSAPGLTIPLAELPAALIPTGEPKRYGVQVDLLTPEGVLASSEALGFTFPPQPNQNPIWRYLLIAAGALVLAGAGFAGWRMWSRRPRREVSRTPYNPPTERLAPPPAYRGPAAPPRPAVPPPAAPPARPAYVDDATQIFHIPTAVSQPRLRIRVLDTPDPAQRRETTITTFPCTIGRGEATVQILGDGSISRLHAEFQLQGGSLTVTDMGSGNGVFLSGSRLPPHQPMRISGPANVRIGLFTTVEVELKS